MSDTTPRVFVDPRWLHARLRDPGLRVIDASLLRSEAEDGTYLFANGREQFVSDGHIPGATHADLISDFSDAGTGLPFSRPSIERFEAAARAIGVDGGSTVVVYDRLNNSWAARLWLLFLNYGHKNTYILNGGLKAWRRAGFSTTVGEAEPARPGDFSARVSDPAFVDIDAVERVVAGVEPALLVSALSPAVFSGAEQHYPRPGHIPGSVNLPFEGLIDQETNRILAERVLANAIVSRHEGRLVTYCGGGIYASGVTAALHELGITDVVVYDGSLTEWAKDPDRPLVVDNSE